MPILDVKDRQLALVKACLGVIARLRTEPGDDPTASLDMCTALAMADEEEEAKQKNNHKPE